MSDQRTPKTYAPMSAKARDTSAGQFMNVSGKADKIIAFIQQHTNAKGYINLTIGQRRQPDEYGNTHSVWLDTWQPRDSSGAVSPERAREELQKLKAATAPSAEPENQDIPF